MLGLVVQMGAVSVVGICHLLALVVDYRGLGSRAELVFVLVRMAVDVVREGVILCVEAWPSQPQILYWFLVPVYFLLLVLQLQLLQSEFHWTSCGPSL